MYNLSRRFARSYRRPLFAVSICLSICLPSSAFAGAAEEIARLNEETTVLTARVAQMEARSKLLAKEMEIARFSATSSALGSPSGVSYASGSSSGSTGSSAMPMVTAIEGVDGNLTAMLSTGGAASRVSRGSQLGGWIVLAIEPGVVTVSRKASGKRGSEPVRLVLTSDALNAAAAGPAPMSMVLPPLPSPAR